MPERFASEERFSQWGAIQIQLSLPFTFLCYTKQTTSIAIPLAILESIAILIAITTILQY